MEPPADKTLLSEERDETMVRALRGILVSEEPVPLGLRSRLEAEMAATRARERKPGWVPLGVIGAILFSVAALSAPFHLSGPAWMLLGLGAVVYVLSLRSLLGRRQG